MDDLKKREDREYDEEFDDEEFDEEYDEEFDDEEEEVQDGEERAVSKKFLKRSRFALRFGRYSLLAVLAVFLIGFLIANRDNISIDNLRRLFAKIDVNVTASSGGADAPIPFDFDSDAVVGTFKDGLVRLTPSRLTIMDSRGTEFFTTNTGFSAPRLLTTGRFVIAYDCGGNRLVVTNSFSVVFEKTLEEPILTVTANEKGHIAVITMGDRHKNTLHIFGNRFEEIFTWQSAERYLLSAALSAGGDRVALSCYNTADAGNNAEIVCIRTGKDEIYWETPVSSLPIAISYKDGSTLAALFSDRLAFYGGKGKEENVWSLAHNFIQKFDLSPENRSVLVLSDGKLGDSVIYTVDNKGKALQETALETLVSDLDVRDDKVAALGENETIILSLSSLRITHRMENEGNIRKVRLGHGNVLFDIYATKAVYNNIE